MAATLHQGRAAVQEIQAMHLDPRLDPALSNLSVALEAIINALARIETEVSHMRAAVRRQ